MTIIQRTLAKGLLPALLLSAALSVPAASVAAPSPKGKAHAADKWDKKDKHQNKKNQADNRKEWRKHQREEAKRVAELRREGRKHRAELRGEQKRQLRQQRFEAQRRAEIRRQAALNRQQQRFEAQRRAELRQQAALQRQTELRRQAELQRQRYNRDRYVYRAPAPAYGDRYVAGRRYAWDGWSRRYSRYGSGVFQLDGTFFDQQHGCALVRDHSGQVIPLVSNPGDLRRGDHLLMTGRVENGTVCGTAFRVFSVDRVWADAGHRRVLFDRRYDGDYYGDRYDRGRYDDRYDDYYDDRYDRDNRDLISVEGRLDRSLFCTSLRGDNGERYGLSGDLRDYRDGDWVRVIGFLEGRSLCGGRTIEVQEITG